MKRNNTIGFIAAILLLTVVLVSCGRKKKANKVKAETSQEKTTTTVIPQGSENQAYEDSIKKVKNELKKLPQK